MKKTLTLLFILFFLCFQHSDLLAQKKSKKKEEKASVELADKYFENMDYYLASQEYEKVYAEEPGNNYVGYRLAEAYRFHFNYPSAEKYYKISVEKALPDFPLGRYWYALMLKLNGKYEEAEKQFQDFINENPNPDSETKKYKDQAEIDKNGCTLAIDEMKKPVRDYEFFNLKSPVNSVESDYSPVIFENDSTIIVTSARPESIGESEYGMLGGEYSDNFRFKKEGLTWKQMDDKDKFSVVNSKFNESGGSFNKDRSKFYFTRCDEPVKTGKIIAYECAIYMTKLESGKWTNPAKLNENINYPKTYNVQPSVSPNSDTLFFVSKREGGMGMHDIYYSTCSGDDNWGKAINMGAEINTPGIDMSPCYYPEDRTLFFSTNGREGFGGLDIFMAKGKNFTEEVQNVGLPFNSSKDDFYFVVGEKKGYLASNRDGGIGNDDIYMFMIESKQALIAQVDKDSLQEAQSISIVGTLIDEETHQPASDVGVILKNEKNETLKRTTTNEKGTFRYENLKPDNYKVTLEDKDAKITAEIKYLVEDVKVKSSDQPVSRVLFENIYFDFDKFDLRPEAKKTLDDLCAYYKKHPEVQIEMNAFTDSYGSDAYNVALSEKRGTKALDYLKSKGLDKSALVVNALGEGKPMVANKNAIGRQLNRRVEFQIIGGPGYQAKAMTYIIEPKVTIEEIAKKYKMSVEELKKLNNLKGQNLEAFAPLRVRRTGDADIVAPSTMSEVDRDEDDVNPNGFVATLNKKTAPLNEGEDYYIAESGNTLFSISRLFGMTPEELIQLNSLKDNTIFAGQKLKVKMNASASGAGKYSVQEGDSIDSIAKKFGLTIEDLKELNKLEGYSVKKGMILRINK